MTANAEAHQRLALDHEALMQFLYLAPVGLVQTAADGAILMINPVSAQLLMPLQRDGNLTNLFDALAGVAPELRHLCAMYARTNGMVCDGLHIHLRGADARPKRAPQVLSLSLLKLDGARLMAVLSDVTEQVRRERRLRENEAWLGALLTSITDYALVSLDGAGRINAWNETIGRVTGHGADVIGQPYAVFHPQGATTPEQAGDRLREADENGWSLDEGPRVRADGREFWASAMISPLPDRDPIRADADESAYCLVLRDISDKRAFFEAAGLDTNHD
jgi:PAS domain S-box-containing protein